MSLSLSPRLRASAAGGLILALSLTTAPAVLAQDAGPEQAVVDLMAAIEAKEFGNLAGYFCAEHADQAAEFDISGLAAGLGADPSTLIDALILDTEITSTEVLSQSDTEAVVKIVGTISTGVDPEKLGPFVEAILAASGQEVTPDMVEMMTGMLTTEMQPTVIDIDEEITLAPGDAGGWVVCDDFGAGAVASPDASAPAAAAGSAVPVPSAEAAG
jgi:hypothetical protein